MHGLFLCLGEEPSQSPTATASSPFCRLAGESASGTNPLSLAALDSSPEGRALGKEGRSRPHSSTAGRSLPLSCKLFASAKASPEGRALGKEGRSRPHSSTAGRSLPLSSKLFAFAKASPFRERWHGEAVTERVAFRDEPLPSFRFAKCHLPRGKLSSSSVNGQKEPAPIPSLDKPVLSCYDGIISNS